MDLRVIREATVDGATIGELSVDGVFTCYTLEDAVREVSGVPVAAWKVPGETAIPRGRYLVEITPSRRFRRLLPLLRNVPGFTGVRIHPGNAALDTSGCLLVGRTRSVSTITDSRVAFEALYQRLLEHWSDETWIEIT